MVTLTLTCKKSIIRLPSWPAKKTTVPGLVVCRIPINFSGDGHPYRTDNGELFMAETQPLNPHRYFYQVVHESSGIAVQTHFYTESEAQEFAGQLGAVDWTVSKEQITQEYANCVRAAYRMQL